MAFTQGLDVNQGYDFQSAADQPFGYVTSWSIGATAVAPDITVVNPYLVPGRPASPGGFARRRMEAMRNDSSRGSKGLPR